MSSYLITKCTNAAHKHIFPSFPNTVIPFQVNTWGSQITKSWGSFPDWSLLSMRCFAYTEKRGSSWCYLIVLILSRLPLISKGIHRIRACWFWAFFKGFTARQNHKVLFSKQFTSAKWGKRISVLGHYGLPACDGVFLQHLLQECSELQEFVSSYSPLHQAGFALHTSCHTST